jgi:hypothetical protein
MQGNVSFEVVKERDTVTNQDREDRIANFVGKPEAKTLGANHTASNNPNRAELTPQAPVHELREIA